MLIEIELMFDELETPRQEKATCAVGLLVDSRMTNPTTRIRTDAPTKQIIFVGVVIIMILVRAKWPNG